MREVVLSLLWTSNAHDARDVRSVLAAGVAAVVDLAIEEPPAPFPRDVVYCRFPLLDGEGNPPGLLAAAMATTANLVAARLPTLVACSNGMSRSPAIAAAALAKVEGVGLVEALSRVASTGPCDVSPGLWTSIDPPHARLPGDVSLRAATAEDAPLLARMNRELIEDEASRNPMSLTELEARMQTWLMQDWEAAVVEERGRPVGYILFQFRRDEYDPSGHTVYVRQFLVEREHRNRGIGRAAFEAVLTTCFSAVSAVVLDVLETNPRARRFWESLGFRPYCTTMRLTEKPT